jgi:hypothetical protein
VQNLCLLLSSTLLILSFSSLAETQPPAPGNKTFIFRDETRNDFVLVSEKVDGKTEVRHIDAEEYENAIKELKKEGSISVCS